MISGHFSLNSLALEVSEADGIDCFQLREGLRWQEYTARANSLRCATHG